MLESLEAFREEVDGLFEHAPGDIAVVLHPRAAALTLAHPWLPLARMVAAPASRRYFAGWFTEADIHVLSPPALERRASKVPGLARGAAALAPSRVLAPRDRREQPGPPSAVLPRRLPSLRALGLAVRGRRRVASGQTPHLRAAIVRRLREGGRPEFPPSARDAMLLGGTIFSMLEREGGPGAAAALATSPLDDRGARGVLVEAFGRPLAAVERDWRAELDSLSAAS